MDRNVYLENSTWSYRYKVIRSYSIFYEIERGFEDEESARLAYEDACRTYQEELNRIKALTEIRFTFMEYLDYWYNTYVAGCTESSIVFTYKWAIEQIIKPLCEEDVLLGRITSAYINNLIKKCSAYSRTSGETVSKVINNALRAARSLNYIGDEVTAGVKTIPRNKPQVPVLCTTEQIRKLLQGAREYSGGIHYFEILLALFCGLRSGEIRGLRFSDFSPEEKTLCIRRQCTLRYYTTTDIEAILDSEAKEDKDGRVLAIKPPKSAKSCRKLLIPDFIFTELESRRELNKEIFRNLSDEASVYRDFVSISSTGEFKSANTMRNALEKICARSGIPHTSMHGLRHMFATILLENGRDITLEEVSNIMGHKSVGTTFDVYCGIIQAREEIRETIEQKVDPFSSYRRAL